MTARLEVEGVRLAYGAREVLRAVSLVAGSGEFVALTGNNGAGKSSLLDVIAGVRDADAGVVRVDSQDVRSWRGAELARRLSHLPQTLHADLPFTAGQVVGMGRYPHTDRWFESDDDRREIEAAMRRTRCWEFRARGFASLSGGERQRVLLAACIAQAAGVLLLDEPSTFLDVAAQLECFALLREEAQVGKLCVAVTHDLNLALTFCTRVLVLDQGRIARDFAVEDAAENEEWLGLFSPELRMGKTEAGRPWVWYG